MADLKQPPRVLVYEVRYRGDPKKRTAKDFELRLVSGAPQLVLSNEKASKRLSKEK